MKTLRPSSSYQIVLPDGTTEKTDERVSSYWLDGEPMLLQVSSYIRYAGVQTDAMERLRDRIAKSTASWNIWNTRLHGDPDVDEAVGEMKDENGLTWLHIYLVWPHLTVYATISGPEELVGNENNWAYEALKGIRLSLQ